MNHNFADWELTQLLSTNKTPIGWWYKENSKEEEIESCFTVLNLPPNLGYFHRKHHYVKYKSKYGKTPTCVIDKRLLTNPIVQETAIQILSNFHYTGVTAWTWEDIRLYLLEQGFQVNINPVLDSSLDFKYYYYNVFKNGISINHETHGKRGDNCFPTYEEARRAGIIYCLNLIKKSNDSNKSNKTT